MPVNQREILLKRPEEGLPSTHSAARKAIEFYEWFEPLFRDFVENSIADSRLLERCRYAIRLSGMRERALLTWLASRVCGVSWESISPFALAAECFMCSAFTGDDILDCAHFRWKHPSVWKVWGRNEAWITAETLHSLAHRALRGQTSAAVETFTEAFDLCFSGQLGTIASPREYSVHEVIESAWARTGALVAACVAVPSFIRQGKFHSELLEFGRALGISLQLADDIYDFIGVEEEMGKPLFGDLLNGQPNLVLALAAAQPSSSGKEDLLALLGAGSVAARPNREKLLRTLRDINCLYLAREELGRWIKKAEEALDNLPDTEARSDLIGFVRLIEIFPSCDE